MSSHDNYCYCSLTEINDKCSAVLTAAASQLTAVKECDKESRRRALETALLKCKMHLRDVAHIRPPPSIREARLIVFVMAFVLSVFVFMFYGYNVLKGLYFCDFVTIILLYGDCVSLWYV